jgi:LPPG:FO 2-phospho-L-lactate transferase
VAAHYGARTAGGLLDAWVMAEEDAALAPAVQACGIHPVVAPLWMTDAATTEAVAQAALQA